MDRRWGSTGDEISRRSACRAEHDEVLPGLV
jgi:hypothetical protein